MNKILILSRYKNHSKNFLIFLPLLISNKSLNISFIDLVIPFCIFIIIASVIYVTNDFLDYNIDVNNKLKKNFLIKEVSFFKIFIFNIFLYLFILFLYFTKYFGYSLVFYVLIFYLYNFFLKKIKYLDITCLVSFHLLRLFYGAEAFNVQISSWFIIFFGVIFIILAILKRINQINVNNLETDNLIIPYDKEDIKNLELIIISLLFINFLFFIIYMFKDIYNFNYIFNSSNTPILNKYYYFIYSIIYFLFLIFIFKIIKKIKKNSLGKDITEYIQTSKEFILITLISFFLLVFIKFFT